MKEYPPRIELLKDAFAIINGIPDKQVTLQYAVSHPTAAYDEKLINQIRAPMGWLAAHPKFIELGLHTVDSFYNAFAGNLDKVELWNVSIQDSRKKNTFYKGIAAMEYLFKIPYYKAVELFQPRSNSIHDWGLMRKSETPVTDKQLWEMRVRDYLETWEK